MEIMLAALLLTGMMVSLFAAFSTAGGWIQQSENGPAYNLLRERAERLQDAVRQDTWAVGGVLVPGSYGPEGITLDGVTYSRQYTVAAVAGKDYRKATVKVTW